MKTQKNIVFESIASGAGARRGFSAPKIATSYFLTHKRAIFVVSAHKISLRLPGEQKYVVFRVHETPVWNTVANPDNLDNPAKVM